MFDAFGGKVFTMPDFKTMDKFWVLNIEATFRKGGRCICDKKNGYGSQLIGSTTFTNPGHREITALSFCETHL